jgi:hypothetical protein
MSTPRRPMAVSFDGPSAKTTNFRCRDAGTRRQAAGDLFGHDLDVIRDRGQWLPCRDWGTRHWHSLCFEAAQASGRQLGNQRLAHLVQDHEQQQRQGQP